MSNYWTETHIHCIHICTNWGSLCCSSTLRNANWRNWEPATCLVLSGQVAQPSEHESNTRLLFVDKKKKSNNICPNILMTHVTIHHTAFKNLHVFCLQSPPLVCTFYFILYLQRLFSVWHSLFFSSYFLQRRNINLIANGGIFRFDRVLGKIFHDLKLEHFTTLLKIAPLV